MKTDADRLAAAVRKLSEPLQLAVWLRHAGEMNIEKVTVAWKISPGTVKSGLFSTTARLRQKPVGQHGFFCLGLIRRDASEDNFKNLEETM